MGIVPLIISTLLQAAAAWWALRLAWSVRSIAWLAVSLAVLLMASRRAYTLYNALAFGQPVSLGAESIALLISILMLFGLYYLARRRPRAAEPDSETLRAPVRLTRAALAIGSLCILGSVIAGFYAYNSSRETLTRLVFEQNLHLARSLAAHAEKSIGRPRDAIVAELEELWRRSGTGEVSGFLCVIDRDSRLLLHTAQPERVGLDVSANALQLRGRDGPTTLAEMVGTARDWVGYYYGAGGERQVAAFAYVKGLDVFISVHAPEDQVEAQIASTVLPWIGGFLFVTAGLLPLALGLLHWAYSTSSRTTDQARRTLEIRAREQAAVADFGRRALAGTTPEALMDAAVRTVAETLRVEYCKVLEYRPERNDFLLCSGVGWRPGAVGHATVAGGRDSQAGYTLLSNEPVIVEDLRTERRFRGPQLLHDHGVVSGLSVIIHGKDRPFGVLGAHSSQRRIFSRDDAHFLQAMANVLAEAIEWRRAEQALRESEEKYRMIFAHSPLGLLHFDAHGVITACNEKFAEIMGAPVERIVGFDMPASLRDPQMRAAVADCLSGRCGRYEGDYLSVTGNKLTALKAEFSPITGEDGACLGGVGVFEDITERRRQHEGLAKLDRWVRKLMLAVGQPEAFYRLVCAGVRELVAADLAALPLLDETGKICTYVAADGRCAELLRGRAVPLDGSSLCGWVAHHGTGLRVDALANDARADPQFLKATGVTAALIAPLVHADKVSGGLSAFRAGRPFDALDEQLLNLYAQRVSIMLEYMRLLATLERRIEERTAELAATNKELEAFAYSVSHDLRAPLRAIDGFSQALLEEYAGALDATGKDYLRRVRAASQRMGELIDDLLMLSRVTRGRLKREPVDLSALARRIAKEFKQREPGRRVVFQITPGLMARGDPHLLRLALENLIGNAWKFSAKQAEARIEFGRTSINGRGVYFVRDNGVGFDMRYAKKLFGPFQRLHSSQEFDGSGIGLATVQRILHRHGGRIWGEGAVGKGATFYFTIPR